MPLDDVDADGADINVDTSFTLGRCAHGKCQEYYVLERVSHTYRDIRSVRSCLMEHRQRLFLKLTAIDAILSTTDPERAEHLLLDSASLQVQEIILRPKPSLERFHAFMQSIVFPSSERTNSEI